MYWWCVLYKCFWINVDVFFNDVLASLYAIFKWRVRLEKQSPLLTCPRAKNTWNDRLDSVPPVVCSAPNAQSPKIIRPWILSCSLELSSCSDRLWHGVYRGMHNGRRLRWLRVSRRYSRRNIAKPPTELDPATDRQSVKFSEQIRRVEAGVWRYGLLVRSCLVFAEACKSSCYCFWILSSNVKKHKLMPRR